MEHFVLLWREFRSLLGKLAELPHHPYAPFYAPWDHVLQQRMELVRQQAAANRQIRTLGLQETWKGWAIPAQQSDQSSKPAVGSATP
jgi:hypothetical protein